MGDGIRESDRDVLSMNLDTAMHYETRERRSEGNDVEK